MGAGMMHQPYLPRLTIHPGIAMPSYWTKGDVSWLEQVSILVSSGI